MHFAPWLALLVVAACTGRSVEWAGTVDVQPMAVHVDVPAAQVDLIAVGDTVMIRVAPYPDETFVGKVDRIERTDRAQTYAVRVALVSNAELQAGMAATILVSP